MEGAIGFYSFDYSKLDATKKNSRLRTGLIILIFVDLGVLSLFYWILLDMHVQIVARQNQLCGQMKKSVQYYKMNW